MASDFLSILKQSFLYNVNSVYFMKTLPYHMNCEQLELFQVIKYPGIWGFGERIETASRQGCDVSEPEYACLK